MAPDDATLAELGHLNRLEFERTLARWSGRHGQVVEGEGVLSWASAADFPVLLNGAARIDPATSAEDAVAIAAARFDGLGRGFSLSLRDGHTDDEAVRLAALEAGSVEISSAPEMVVVEPVEPRDAPRGVRLRWADGNAGGTGGAVDDFVAVSDAAYRSLGMPPGTLEAAILARGLVPAPGTRIVLADVDGRPAGAAMALLSHGIAGVYFVGTLEGARGRGVGDLVTRAVTNRAFDEGARAVTLQASPMGEAIYARMGYGTIYRYTTFVRFGPG